MTAYDATAFGCSGLEADLPSDNAPTSEPASRRGSRYAQGVAAGTGQGPVASIEVKSAGPTISMYSMSGE